MTSHRKKHSQGMDSGTQVQPPSKVYREDKAVRFGKESRPDIHSQERVNGNVPLSHDMLLSAPDIHSPQSLEDDNQRVKKLSRQETTADIHSPDALTPAKYEQRVNPVGKSIKDRGSSPDSFGTANSNILARSDGEDYSVEKIVNEIIEKNYKPYTSMSRKRLRNVLLYNFHFWLNSAYAKGLDNGKNDVLDAIEQDYNNCLRMGIERRRWRND